MSYLETDEETGQVYVKPVGRIEGTIGFIWAIFLGILFWPIVVFYNYGALAWILNAIWLVIVGFVWIKIRSYRRATRAQNMGANHGQQQI